MYKIRTLIHRRKKLHNIKKGFIDTHTEKERITYEVGKF